MGDIQRMACPECGHVNAMLGVVNGVRQYLCRQCGQSYYTPETCIGEKKPEPRPRPEKG